MYWIVYIRDKQKSRKQKQKKCVCKGLRTEKRPPFVKNTKGGRFCVLIILHTKASEKQTRKNKSKRKDKEQQQTTINDSNDSRGEND